MDRTEIKNLILFAAIECVEECGMDGVTMRKIARKAGMNSALLHYYYGSKENLMEAVSRATLTEGLSTNILDYEGRWETDTEGALRGFLYDTLTGMLTYPNITKSHFYEVMVNNNYECAAIKEFKQFFEILYTFAGSVMTGKSEQEKRTAFVQMFSIVLTTGLMPGIFPGSFALDLSDDNTRRNFSDSIVDRFTESSLTSKKSNKKS
jgi:AcrR family transcriptional regulator